MTNLAQLDAAPFAPDWVSPPGDTILDLMEERGWTQVGLAKRLNFTTKHVNQLIKGSVPLTEEAALRLSNVFGSSIRFWLNREAQYRALIVQSAAQDKYDNMLPWLDGFPIKEMVKAGILSPCERLTKDAKTALVPELLKFFGIANPAGWDANYGRLELAFRRSREEQSDTKAISVWLRQGERIAEQFQCIPYDQNKLKQTLPKIRALTTSTPKEFQVPLSRLLADAGVVLVFVPAMRGTCVSGVARWLKPHCPLIQLSLYGKQNDKFWFTLFHEIAHIVLHSSEKRVVFLDDPSKSDSNSSQETEANLWARNLLIPDVFASDLRMLKSKEAVRNFAKRIEIHPGVVVGRLQHEGLVPQAWMNDLKVSYSLS